MNDKERREEEAWTERVRLVEERLAHRRLRRASFVALGPTYPDGKVRVPRARLQALLAKEEEAIRQDQDEFLIAKQRGVSWDHLPQDTQDLLLDLLHGDRCEATGDVIMMLAGLWMGGLVVYKDEEMATNGEIDGCDAPRALLVHLTIAGKKLVRDAVNAVR